MTNGILFRLAGEPYWGIRAAALFEDDFVLVEEIPEKPNEKKGVITWKDCLELESNTNQNYQSTLLWLVVSSQIVILYWYLDINISQSKFLSISPFVRKPSTLSWVQCSTRPSETLNRLLLESHELHERTAVLLMSDRRARHVAKAREIFFRLVLGVGHFFCFLFLVGILCSSNRGSGIYELN